MVLFDYVGSDGSDLSAWSRERYSSLEGYARDAAEFCEALDLERAVFVGHSVSAMAGALAARAGRATPDSSPGPGGVTGEGGAWASGIPLGLPEQGTVHQPSSRQSPPSCLASHVVRHVCDRKSSAPENCAGRQTA
ncbi:hypothetical protein GCM10010469_00280 [Streptomyces labedae]|uniref:Alpha/beta hydrolase n=1 Tax=Streptomyces labedae TaxID=285569 RepID=A0ABP6QPM8_9ACTN